MVVVSMVIPAFSWETKDQNVFPDTQREGTSLKSGFQMSVVLKV
jgi:hypothetical protein